MFSANGCFVPTTVQTEILNLLKEPMMGHILLGTLFFDKVLIRLWFLKLNFLLLQVEPLPQAWAYFRSGGVAWLVVQVLLVGPKIVVSLVV